MLISTLTVALLVAPAPRLGSAPQDTADEQTLQHRLTSQVEKAMEANELDGMIVVLGVGDETLMEKGWGRLPGGHVAGPRQPVRAQTLVESLTAIAALQLVGEGKLSLDQPIQSILADLKWEEGEVEIRHLLAQTSGLIGWDATLPQEGRDEVTTAALLEIVKSQGLEANPGTCFEYSESNGLVLGAIIEKVTGKSLADNLTSRVIEPAKLESTGFDVEDAPPTLEGSIGSREIGGESIAAPEGVHPFGEDEFCTTAFDLVRLRRALSDGLILEQAELDALKEMVRLENGKPTGFGLGVNLVRVDDYSGFAVGGAAEEMSMHLAYYPEPDITVVVMAADDEAPVRAIERNLTRLVLDLPLPGIQDLELDRAGAAPYLGSYQLGCDTLVIGWDDEGHVTYTSGNQGTARLLYQGQNRFISSRDSGVEIDFVIEEGAKLAGLMVLKEHGRLSEAVRFPR